MSRQQKYCVHSSMGRMDCHPAHPAVIINGKFYNSLDGFMENAELILQLHNTVFYLTAHSLKRQGRHDRVAWKLTLESLTFQRVQRWMRYCLNALIYAKAGRDRGKVDRILDARGNSQGQKRVA